MAGRIYSMPQITTNTLPVNQGEMVVLNSTMFYVTDVGNTQIKFIVTSVQHGRFENINNIGFPIFEFTQEEVLTGKIQFVHDNSENIPSFNIAVNDGTLTTMSVGGNVIYTNMNSTPLLVRNQLFINQGDTKILNRLNIEVNDDDNPADELTITVTNLKNGYFSTIYDPSTLITQFTQQDINDGKIQFTQQGNDKPSYILTVTDRGGAMTTQNPDSINSIADINFIPKATESNPVPIVVAIAGGATLLGGCLAAGIFYFKKSQERKAREQHKFAQLIRHHLKLKDVDNFKSEDGQRFVRAIQTLSDELLEKQGIDITNINENRLDELAGNIATSAKNKITPDTTKFWKKSKITISEFEENIKTIARDANRRLADLSRNDDDISIPVHTM